LIKHSQPFWKKFQKTAGGIFFDSHCMSPIWPEPDIGYRYILTSLYDSCYYV